VWEQQIFGLELRKITHSVLRDIQTEYVRLESRLNENTTDRVLHDRQCSARQTVSVLHDIQTGYVPIKIVTEWEQDRQCSARQIVSVLPDIQTGYVPIKIGTEWEHDSVLHDRQWVFYAIFKPGTSRLKSRLNENTTDSVLHDRQWVFYAIFQPGTSRLKSRLNENTTASVLHDSVLRDVQTGYVPIKIATEWEHLLGTVLLDICILKRGTCQQSRSVQFCSVSICRFIISTGHILIG
jgi:hypothetical protein